MSFDFFVSFDFSLTFLLSLYISVFRLFYYSLEDTCHFAYIIRITLSFNNVMGYIVLLCTICMLNSIEFHIIYVPIKEYHTTIDHV